MTTRIACFLFLSVLPISSARALPAGFNYDESKVPDFTLPDPLTLENGTPITVAEAWKTKRRPEILKLFATHVFGHTPAKTISVRFGEAEIDEQALDGIATRKQLKIHFGSSADGPKADLLVYLPAKATAPVPLFVGLNFRGNQTTTDDQGVWLPTSWMRKRRNGKPTDQNWLEKQRGTDSGHWPVREIVARGYGVATMYCGDFDPDFDDGFQNGVHPLFYEGRQTQPADDEWGTIGTWAWGLSRALDYFETDNGIDHTQVAVLGHSRLGKTALWAGAQDERFAMVISNGSGCGGAALSRRRFGETVKRINNQFPHWFCRNFHQYNDNEDALPVDQHQLASLIAPRPLYVASAEQDFWADPRGEFLSLKLSSPVYELFGKRAMSDAEMPVVNQPLLLDVGYHIRAGKHDITLYDWQSYMDFADRQFEREN